MAITEQQVRDALQALIDPNTRKDYITGKSLKSLKVEGNNVTVEIALGYPAKSQLKPIGDEITAKLNALAGVGNVTVRELEPVYRKYWALYHIGTAQFIVVMANASLRDLAREKGDLVKAETFNIQATSAAKVILSDFNYAQSYDENGWLWQPAQAVREFVDLPEKPAT